MKYLLSILFSCICFKPEYIIILKNKVEFTLSLKQVYEKHIENIKEFEGLSLKNYKCTAGFNTIGYGCQSELQNINFKQADSILYTKYNECVFYSKKYFILSEKQHYATAQIIFHLGIGTILKYRIVENNQLNFSLLIKYCYSKRMFINRLFIFKMFYS